MLETEQILGGGDAKIRIISEIADGNIASAAQESADCSSRVRMIDVEFLNASITSSGFGLLANGAERVLLNNQGNVLIDSDAVFRPQVIFAEIADPSFFYATFCKLAILFGLFLFLFQCSVLAMCLVCRVRASLARTIFEHTNVGFNVPAWTDGRPDLTDSETTGIAVTLIRAVGLALLIGSISPLLTARDATAFSTEAAFQCAYDIFVVAVFAEVLIHGVRSLSQITAYDKGRRVVA